MPNIPSSLLLKVLVLLLAAAGLVGLLLMQEVVDWRLLIEEGRFWMGELAKAHPLWLISLMAIIPLFGLPMSPLMLVAGLYGPVEGMLYAMTGLALNNTLAYFLASRWMRGLVIRVLKKRDMKVPDVPAGEEIKIIALFRLTPGIPLPLQNYLLGMSSVRFWTYTLWSLLFQSIPVAAFVIFGGAIYEGKMGLILLAGILLVVMAIVGRLYLNAQKRKKRKVAQTDAS